MILVGDTRLNDQFWRQVAVARAGCWLWTGCWNHAGYGMFGKSGAHRRAYRALVGPIPPGLDLDHLCRVRCCVNPEHLEPVTRAENNRRRGSYHHSMNNRAEDRTHCPKGHPYDEANTYLKPAGGRDCRACHAITRDARRARQRAVGLAVT